MTSPRRFAALAGLPLALACGTDASGPPARLATPVQLSASLAGSAVEWLSVEVSATDVPVPVVVTLAVTGSVARGTVTVPSGTARTFTARGYDVEGTLTHRAALTRDVASGAGATLALVLLPMSEAGVGAGGDDRVTPSASDVALPIGATRRLTASITRADGTAVPNASIRWATLDPRVATVSGTGLVSAIAPGSTQVVALSGGGAGVVNVTVQ